MGNSDSEAKSPAPPTDVEPAQVKTYQANPAKSVQEISQLIKPKRSGHEATAEALTAKFGGADGFANHLFTLVMASETRPATRARIIEFCMTHLERASKMYGDPHRLGDVLTEDIELMMCGLLLKHNFIVPIEGVDLGISLKQIEAESISNVNA